ncbi:RWD domain-containing protein 4-like [Haliotis rufescens]|uniref:RWD domain-containing protein 4-like n=1 Tax=Haliotis rufescens TaxID=6454 RepID=UPI001EAFF90A|nr:RWD domain-containing protein 4-like [Haliotis rufescens]XP_046333093.1 RWD domain-containing protein 4-like [Haliotis rufescens]
MSCQEQQEEELEVLHSIYDGDGKFKQISPTCFQYKYGEDGDHQAFLVEISWGDSYPEEAPNVNLDLFYNKHILDGVKEKVRSGILEEVENLLSSPMTFSLFEWVKDNLASLLEEQPESAPVNQAESRSDTILAEDNSPEKKREKKEQMTKAQKRKYFDKYGANTDRPRGWDWVDVVKHLSQTGGQQQKNDS